MEKAKKSEIIAKYQRNEGDTGSPEVQIAILTERILFGRKQSIIQGFRLLII